MRKLLVAAVLCALACSACSAEGARLPPATAAPESVSPSLPATAKALDPSVECLLAMIAKSDSQADIDWVQKNYLFPPVVNEYGGTSDITAKYVKPDMEKVLAYVKAVDGNQIELDDVEWRIADNDAGYDVINTAKGYKPFTFAQDAMIFVNFEGTDILYSIPLEFLGDQISYKNNSLFTAYVEDGKVKLLFEHSVS
jgi:hypothetical protein